MNEYKAHIMMGSIGIFVDFVILYDVDPVVNDIYINDIRVTAVDCDCDTHIPMEWLSDRGYYEPLRQKILRCVRECTDFFEDEIRRARLLGRTP